MLCVRGEFWLFERSMPEALPMTMKTLLVRLEAMVLEASFRKGIRGSNYEISVVSGCLKCRKRGRPEMEIKAVM